MLTRRRFFRLLAAAPFVSMAALSKPKPVYGPSKIEELWKAGLLTHRQAHFACGGLLPQNDGYLVGSQPPETILPLETYRKVIADENGVHDDRGNVAGHWHGDTLVVYSEHAGKEIRISKCVYGKTIPVVMGKGVRTPRTLDYPMTGGNIVWTPRDSDV